MTAPPDLTTDRLESIRARAVQGYAPTMRDTLNLVAEVERLRAENEKLAHEVQAHQTTSDYERGHEHGTLAGLKTRDAVPRSSLAQVGFYDKEQAGQHGAFLSYPHDWSEPVYVIREDTDA